MDTLYYIGIVPSSLSFLGCTYIISTVLIFKELHTFLFRVLMYLAIANLITSISILLPYIDSDTLCKTQGFLISFGSLSSLLWTACIMYSIHQLIVKEKKASIRFEIFTNVGIWALSAAVAGISVQLYVHGTGWCWINPKHHLYQSIFAFYAPYLCVLAFDLFICLRIKSYFKTTRESGEILSIKKAAVKKFMFYPLILVICYIPVFVHRFFASILSGLPESILNILAVFGVTIIGFVCFILYACTKFVRSTVYNYFSPKIEVKSISLLSADSIIKS